MPVKFVLFDISSSLVKAWQRFLPALVPPEALEHITIKDASLDDLGVSFDTIVSPANSFGRLDGRYAPYRLHLHLIAPTHRPSTPQPTVSTKSSPTTSPRRATTTP